MVKKKAILNLKKGFLNFLPIALFLVFWEIAPKVGLVNPTFIPPFSSAIEAVFRMTQSLVIFKHIVTSLYRSFLGFTLAIILGLPIGMAIGRNKTISEFLGPLLNLFGQVSPMALFPVFIILFGVGEVSKVGIIFWGCVWPILLNTISGVAHVDQMLIKAAKSMGASQVQILWKVILPHATPEIFPGLKLSVSLSIVMLCASEMLGAKAGLGFLISYSQQVFQLPNMYAAIILIAILGVLLSRLLDLCERKFMTWKTINKT